MIKPDITTLLRAVHRGDKAAEARLFDATYPDLRRIAASRVGGNSAADGLQPTVLVNEAVLRILRSNSLSQTSNRYVFFSLVAKAMRSVLVDHVRRRNAGKRNHGGQRCTLDDIVTQIEQDRQIDILALDEALTMLQTRAPRPHEVVLLRFFSGLSNPAIAETLGVSVSTVEKDWYFARSWLRKTMATD